MRIAITLLLIVLMGTSHAQQPALRSALGGKPAVAATVDVAEERAKLETLPVQPIQQTNMVWILLRSFRTSRIIRVGRNLILSVC